MTDRMTCIFECDVTKLRFNPHQVDTPFGKAVVVSASDVCAEYDKLETDSVAEIHRLRKIESLARDLVTWWYDPEQYGDNPDADIEGMDELRDALGIEPD